MNARILAILLTVAGAGSLGAAAATTEAPPPPRQDKAKVERTGIDCTHGVACPIIWAPPPASQDLDGPSR